MQALNPEENPLVFLDACWTLDWDFIVKLGSGTEFLVDLSMPPIGGLYPPLTDS